MFHKIIEVNTAVFKYFSERLSKELGVTVRYARKSSYDYTEEQPQQIYPCVAIQDYVPTPRENWWIEHKPFHRANSMDGTTGYLFYLPLWMDFRYDISIASKSYKEYLNLQQWFLENVISEDEITLESFKVGGIETGEPISIESRAQDVPRTDGVYETSYEVTFAVWVFAREPKSVTNIQEVIIRLHEGTLKTAKVAYKGNLFTMPTKKVSDYITWAIATGEDYSGIRAISSEEYDALEEKDPQMLYVIH